MVVNPLDWGEGVSWGFQPAVGVFIVHRLGPRWFHQSEHLVIAFRNRR